MSARRRVAGGVALLLAASPLRAQRGEPPPRQAWAHLTYLTLSSAYVDAGTADGLVEGTRLEVMRGDSAVAVLRARFVATHRAACDIVSATVTLAVGDTARFTLASPARDTAAVAALRVARAPAAPDGAGGVRGRIGVYYLTVQQLDGSGAAFSQPSGDVRVTGSRLGGTGLGLLADVRSRRMVQTRADGLGTEARGQTRVYQAALSWQTPGSSLRLALGRQFAPGIPPAGLVDGMSARLVLGGWTAGVFAGTQPEPVDLQFTNATTQLGVSLGRHDRGGAASAWSVTTGLSGSYVHGAANREFLYLQGGFSTRRVALYAAQEVDYYRADRRVGGEGALSPTSTFASLRLELADGFSVRAGVDNRRNVRLYRDVVDPEAAFDDAFRRGVWAGVTARLGERVHASVDARASRGGTTGPADSYTLLLSATPRVPLGAALRSRSTRYSSMSRTGWLEALALGFSPRGATDLELSGGWRLERDRRAQTTVSLRWLSGDVDVGVARSWYLLLSAYREWGGLEAHALLYGGLSYRF